MSTVSKHKFRRAEGPASLREREYKIINPPKPTMGYIVLTAAFSTIFFVFFYFTYIMPRDKDIFTFLLLWFFNYLAGFVGSVCARILTAYYHDMSVKKPGKFHNRQVVSALIYTILIWTGFVTEFIVIRYIDINTMTVAEFLTYLTSREFIEIVALLFALKLFIFMGSELIGTRMAGG
jgi:hypothetical protein